MRDDLDRYYTPRHALQPLVQALNLDGPRAPSHVMVLPRVSFTGDGRTDNVTSCWIVWRANHTGHTETTFHPRTTT